MYLLLGSETGRDWTRWCLLSWGAIYRKADQFHSSGATQAGGDRAIVQTGAAVPLLSQPQWLL